MYLKKLEISGFKSFANSTILEFNPPADGHFSITAIVGPNGSGKSNVADAVRWVLGEQSLKQLRGKTSEDIIFSGSENRGHLSVASVSMVLDNHDHRAAIEYEELIITRRVYRSGESEYLINGNQVRLLDLQLLLAQAQFGHGSYGVIGQGMIDRLLLQSPAERKSFFDEAVGIKEFQIKRHQSYLKLCRTKENIIQAEQLLVEIEPHLKNLKRQAKKLTERQEVEAQLVRLLTDYYANVYEHLSLDMSKRQIIIARLEQEYQKQSKELFDVQTELAELAKSASRQEQFNALEHEYQTLTKQKIDLERNESILAGRLRTEYSKVGKQNIAWLEEKIAGISARLSELSGELNRLEETLAAARDVRERAEVLAQESMRERAEVLAKTSRLEKQWLDARQSDHEISFSGLRSAEEILRMRNQFDGVVHGLVAQLGSVEEKFRLALEVAAGSQLSSIVVEHDRVAEQCISFLKERQLGVVTFLPLNKIRPRAIPHDAYAYTNKSGVYGLAVDLVQFRPELSHIFSFVFGATMIVDSIAIARELGIGRLRMVTLAGDVLDMNGSMKGGYRRLTSSSLHFTGGRNHGFSASVDDIEHALNAARAELKKLEQNERASHDAVHSAQLHEQTLTEKIRLARETQNLLSIELSGLESERSLGTMDEKDYTAFTAELTNERELLVKKMSEVDKKINNVRDKMSAFNREEEAQRQRIFILQDTMQKSQSGLNEIVAKKNSEQMEFVKLETRREDTANDGYAELKQSPDLWQKNCSEKYTPEQFEFIKNEITKLKYRLSLIGGIDEDVLREYEETQARHNGLSDQLHDLNKAVEDIENLINELDAVMKKKHSAAFSKIRKEFARYFAILFEGGKADLVEVYGEESINEDLESDAEEIGQPENVTLHQKKNKILTGIEVVAVPPGKKIKNIAALSGGERTLTSIALVSAILHTNPPPFVFLDEVEAALDESNTIRFNTILQELSTRSQFILITHNRATMHVADVLYGVTMRADGVSNLLSVKLQDNPSS